MSWKDFFKPTKLSIGLFSLLLILSFFGGFFNPFVAGGYEVIRNPILIPFSTQEIICSGGCSMPPTCPELMNLCDIQSLYDYLNMEPHFFVLTMIYWFIVSTSIARLISIIRN